MENLMNFTSSIVRRSIRTASPLLLTVAITALLIVPSLRAQNRPGKRVPTPGVTTITQNPLQIAIFHWYEANTTANFGAANTPLRIAFDGSSVWVVNRGAGTVSKRQASDGTNLGPFTVGGAPQNIAFDGSHIWVSDGASGSHNLFKLRASDGALLATITVGQIGRAHV